MQPMMAMKKAKMGASPEMVGVDEAKAIVFRRLRGVAVPGPGYMHFPLGRPEEYYRQLTGAKLVTKYQRRGVVAREWHKAYHADEALDCRNYAYAAILLSGISLLPRVAPKPSAAPKRQTVAPGRAPVRGYRDVPTARTIR